MTTGTGEITEQSETGFKKPKSIKKVNNETILVEGNVQNIGGAVDDLKMVIKSSNLKDDKVFILKLKGLPLNAFKGRYDFAGQASLDEDFPVQCRYEPLKGYIVMYSSRDGYPIGSVMDNQGRCF